MGLCELIGPEDFMVAFRARDKWEAIHELVHHMVRGGRVSEAQAANLESSVLEREHSMSTGMERGIAIPHAAVDGLQRPVACAAIVADPAGVPFESVDARPTRLIVLLLIPRAQKLQHIRTLADLARVLSREPVRDALFKCSTSAEAWQVLASAESGQSVPRA
jgi:PTS system fructose-specific IIA component